MKMRNLRITESLNRRINILLFSYSVIPLFFHSASAAVPLRWTVETSRATPAQFEAYQGETLSLEAALTSYGKPLEAPSEYSLFWQTNGMGSAWWSVPCTPPNSNTLNSNNSNTLFATWSPTNDVGARVYNCFIGKPGTIYHAAFQLRLRPSPGSTPNELPLPQKVIDFAKVTVLNPPWSGGGGGGGVDTNAVIDIIHKTVDGSAKTLPKYLWLYEADDSYPDAAAEYYRSRGNGRVDGGCSSVRDGGFLYRNFDYPFDDRAEFVVKMSAGNGRFASVGVAQVGTNLTEQIVTSGKWSKWYKWLPGATVDGINEQGVACNINVVDGDPQISGWHNDTGDLHPLAAIRWILDHATNAQHAAEYIAAHIAFPAGWEQNFHYMIADAEKTYFVENGVAVMSGNGIPLTNFRLYPSPDRSGAGYERFLELSNNAPITNVWYTNAYRRETNPPWMSDLAEVLDYTNDIYNAWASHPKEYFRGKTTNGQPWWQTVHTSVYDLTNRVLRVAVQETDDWYTFQVPSSGAKIDAYTKSETDAKLAGKASVSGGFIDDRVEFIGKIESLGGAPVINVRDRILDGGDWVVEGDIVSLDGSHNEHSLNAKADRPVDFDPSHAGNIAVLSGTGNLMDSNIGTDERGIKIEASGGVTSVQLNDGGVYIESYMPGAGDVTVVDNSSYPSVRHDLSAKADRSMISATNPTFSNEVAEVAKTVTPQPSLTLRLFDPVLNRWVILKSVNMNLTLEVE